MPTHSHLQQLSPFLPANDPCTDLCGAFTLCTTNVGFHQPPCYVISLRTRSTSLWQASGVRCVKKKKKKGLIRKRLREWMNECRQWPLVPLWGMPFINWKFTWRNFPFLLCLSWTKLTVITKKELNGEVWTPLLWCGSEAVPLLLHRLPNSCHRVIPSANNH